MFNAEQKTRRISLAITLLFIFLIAFSRLYHGVHAYNQILLGWIFGGALYFFFCHVVYNDMIHFVQVTHKKSWFKLIFNKGTFVFYTIYAIAVFNFLFGDMIHPVPEEWKQTIIDNCQGVVMGKMDPPETENFIRFNLAMTIAGSYVGLIIEQRWMGTRKYRQFYKTKPFTTMLRILLTSIVGCPTLCGIFLCPRSGIHWTTKLLFKTVIPITLGNFYLFGFAKYVALKAQLINTTVVEDDDWSSSTGDSSPTSDKKNVKEKQN